VNASLVEVLTGLGIDDIGDLEVVGDADPPELSSPLAVTECAVASVGACLLAAADLSQARGDRRPAVTLDTNHVAAAVRSEAWLRDPTGAGMSGFAPLSRLWPTSDGWVRTHANYPWHRAALLEVLGVSNAVADVENRVGDAIAARTAADVERAVYAAGGLAVAARTVDEWRESAPGRAVAATSLVTRVPVGSPEVAQSPPAPTGLLPASGIKVVDLTRVIAGPVATRMLGALGADVLRVDNPSRPELPLHAVDGVIGKTSATIDAATPAGREVLHALIDEADVLVTGYRPGALRHLGLEPDQVAQRHPGTITVTLSAWGTTGPWGGRRGFDSLVQVASGIGWSTSSDGERPGALTCQLLDHATGYLTAAGTLAALATRARTGQTDHVSLSLARTAQWLLEKGPRHDDAAVTVEQAAARADRYRTDLGAGWTSISPPGHLDGKPLTWPHLPPRYASADPTWG
jgi:crotonobetainyl-CoA:carnitine CoA-transferase CaiB-like acyl-CoA transferase